MAAPSLHPAPLWLFNLLLKFAGNHIIRKHKDIIERATLAVDGGETEMLIIKPQSLPDNSPCLIYYHGGAFALQYSPQHLENAIYYAQQANICIIFCTYRFIPKHPFPTGFNDAYKAAQWVFENANNLNINADKIAIDGDSAGGCLATVIAQKLTAETEIKLCGQLLIYPTTDKNSNSSSIKKFYKVPLWDGATTQKMWDLYLQNVDRNNPPLYASPIDGVLEGLPNAYVETAEFDPLHDEGMAYAQKMRDAGVEVETYESKGAFHGFDILAHKTKIAQTTIAQRIKYLRRIFN